MPDEQTITITLPSPVVDRLHELATYASVDLSTAVLHALAIADSTVTLDEAYRLHAAGTIDLAEREQRVTEGKEITGAALVALRPKPPATYNPN